MVKVSEKHQPGHPVDRIFVDRWSLRAIAGEEELPEQLQARELPTEWRPLAQGVCQGPFFL